MSRALEMPVSMPPRARPSFVDADDYIDAQTVECVLHAMESADAEVAVLAAFASVRRRAQAGPATHEPQGGHFWRP